MNRQRKGRILIVHPDARGGRELALALEALGYRADAVADGAQAVESVTRVPYALVLVAAESPSANGNGAARLLQQSQAGARVPVFTLRNGSNGSPRAGATGTLRLPLEAAVIDAIIDARPGPDSL